MLLNLNEIPPHDTRTEEINLNFPLISDCSSNTSNNSFINSGYLYLFKIFTSQLEKKYKLLIIFIRNGCCCCLISVVAIISFFLAEMGGLCVLCPSFILLSSCGYKIIVSTLFQLRPIFQRDSINLSNQWDFFFFNFLLRHW